MKPYDKINSVWKRTPKGEIIPEFATSEIEYLKDNDWIWTEKVDGTNIRLSWEPGPFAGNEHAYIAGRTDNAQIPPFLFEKLLEIQRRLPWDEAFEGRAVDSVTLYGEGYGARIQGGGGNYIPDGTDFVLFDVLVCGPERDWWLQREDVVGVATKMGLDVVQEVFRGNIRQAVHMVASNDFQSAWPGVTQPEGLVGRPAVPLLDRSGRRIATKVKHVDLKDPHVALKLWRSVK